MHRTTILLPEKLRRASESLAGRRGISLGALIREQLEKVTRGEGSSGGRRADRLFGNVQPSGRDVPADLAARHDEYLYGEKEGP